MTLIDRVGPATCISKLDLLKGYWQVPLTPHASDIAAFVTPDAFMQYTVMPFGLKNAPATFQRLMQSVLGDVPNCNVYLDDVVVHSNNWDSHMTSLKTVFQCLTDTSLTLNLAKCEFGKAMVTYLGEQGGHGQVRPVEAKVSAVVSFPVPTTRRGLWRFLGMVGYYRCFCKNFSFVVTPPLLGCAVLQSHSSGVMSVSRLLARLNQSCAVLPAPIFSSPFKLEVDAKCHWSWCSVIAGWE